MADLHTAVAAQMPALCDKSSPGQAEQRCGYLDASVLKQHTCLFVDAAEPHLRSLVDGALSVWWYWGRPGQHCAAGKQQRVLKLGIGVSVCNPSVPVRSSCYTAR